MKIPGQLSVTINSVDDDGTESLINGEMQDGRFIIDGTPKKLIFRLDALTATATRSRLRGKRR